MKTKILLHLNLKKDKWERWILNKSMSDKDTEEEEYYVATQFDGYQSEVAK